MKRQITKAQKIAAEKELKENPINVFICCGENMPFKDFQEHLTNKHKLTKEQFKGKKRMLSHMDGDYWFSSDYEWELESGLKFHQHIMMARAKDDMMRFG